MNTQTLWIARDTHRMVHSDQILSNEHLFEALIMSTQITGPIV